MIAYADYQYIMANIISKLLALFGENAHSNLAPPDRPQFIQLYRIQDRHARSVLAPVEGLVQLPLLVQHRRKAIGPSVDLDHRIGVLLARAFAVLLFLLDGLLPRSAHRAVFLEKGGELGQVVVVLALLHGVVKPIENHIVVELAVRFFL